MVSTVMISLPTNLTSPQCGQKLGLDGTLLLEVQFHIDLSRTWHSLLQDLYRKEDLSSTTICFMVEQTLAVQLVALLLQLATIMMHLLMNMESVRDLYNRVCMLLKLGIQGMSCLWTLRYHIQMIFSFCYFLQVRIWYHLESKKQNELANFDQTIEKVLIMDQEADSFRGAI